MKAVIGVGVFLAVFSGLLQQPAIAPSPSPTPPVPRAQLGMSPLQLELVTTVEDQARGLSGRASLPADQGMLFVFDEPQQYVFWMKDMQFAIDIIWMHDEKIVDITHNLLPPTQTTHIAEAAPIAPANQVLEVAAGVAAESGVAIGDMVELQLE